MTLPAPQIRLISGITVVDDSKVGTKTRIARGVAEQTLCKHFYYATRPDGASPVALAEACHANDIELTLLSTQHNGKNYPAIFRRAQSLGAKVEIIPTHDINDVAQLAINRAQETNAQVFDFTTRLAIKILADFAKSLGLNPGEVWSASARGAMSQSFQEAWFDAAHMNVIAIDNVENADFGKAKLFRLPTYKPGITPKAPFPCNGFYEERAWEIAEKYANRSKNPLFWNPAGPN